jgi:hypothetical protein
MKYQPGDFAGLDAAQVEKMKDLCLTRPQFDQLLAAQAHGNLCQSLHHLALAREWFATHRPERVGRLRRVVLQLHEVVRIALDDKGAR